jgi:hypothetical protein
LRLNEKERHMLMILIYGQATGEERANWYMKCNDKHRHGKKLFIRVAGHWRSTNVFGSDYFGNSKMDYLGPQRLRKRLGKFI